MKRIMFELTDDMKADIEKVVAHFKDLDPDKVSEIMTAVEERKAHHWQNMRDNLRASLAARSRQAIELERGIVYRTVFIDGLATLRPEIVYKPIHIKPDGDA